MPFIFAMLINTLQAFDDHVEVICNEERLLFIYSLAYIEKTLIRIRHYGFHISAAVNKDLFFVRKITVKVFGHFLA